MTSVNIVQRCVVAVMLSQTTGRQIRRDQTNNNNNNNNDMYAAIRLVGEGCSGAHCTAHSV